MTTNKNNYSPLIHSTAIIDDGAIIGKILKFGIGVIYVQEQK